MDFSIDKYGKIFADLYQPEKLNSLGSGQPDKDFAGILNSMSIDSNFAANPKSGMADIV